MGISDESLGIRPLQRVRHPAGPFVVGGCRWPLAVTRNQPDRGKINMGDDAVVRCWCKHLGVTRDQLQRIVDKVGNAARAVEKELGRS